MPRAPRWRRAVRRASCCCRRRDRAPRHRPLPRSRTGVRARVRGGEHLVADREAVAGEVLLEFCLVVDVALHGELDVLVEHLDDGWANRFEAKGEVDRADEGLGEVGEHVLVGFQLLGLAASCPVRGSRPAACPDPSARRHSSARRATDDVGAQRRELALGDIGEAAVQFGRDTQSKDAVAEEFEALVRLGASGRPRGVREDLLQRDRIKRSARVKSRWVTKVASERQRGDASRTRGKPPLAAHTRVPGV